MICLPGGREGMRLTASRAAPYPGGCLMRAKPAAAGCLPSPRSARPPAHRAALPAAARGKCFALIYRQRRHHAGSGGQAVPSATSTVPPLSFSRSSCLPIDAATMRFGGGSGCKSPRGLAPPPDGIVVKWNLFDCARGLLASASLVLLPLFHLTPLPPAARGRLSVLAKAKPVFHGSGSALWFCLGYGLPYWLPGLIGLGLGLNPIECRTLPCWMRGGRAGSRLGALFGRFSASVGAPSRSERAAA